MALQVEIIPVTPFQQNCSLVWCDVIKAAVFVDPGGEQERLLAALAKHGLNLTEIWLTHGHLDHVGAAANIAEQQQVPIIGPHKDDDFWLQQMATQAQMFGFSAIQTFTPTRWLQQGDALRVGKEILQVLHCPGHTPGHVVFYHQSQGLLFVGDVLFHHSIGRTDFPRGNHEALIASIKQQLLVLDDAVEFIPGHGPMSTIGEERRNNPFLQG